MTTETRIARWPYHVDDVTGLSAEELADRVDADHSAANETRRILGVEPHIHSGACYYYGNSAHDEYECLPEITRDVVVEIIERVDD